MQQIQHRVHALETSAYLIRLKCSTWLFTHRRLLIGILLVMLVGIVLLTAIFGMGLLYTSSSHLPQAGPGCGPNCVPPL